MNAAQVQAIGVVSGRSRGSRAKGVWAQNRETVLAFLSIASQWRTGVEMVPGGGLRTLYLGLDYAGCRSGLKLAGITVTGKMWAGIRIMESAARDALNSKG